MDNWIKVFYTSLLTNEPVSIEFMQAIVNEMMSIKTYRKNRKLEN